MTDRELMQMALDAMRAVSVDEHLCNAAHHVKKDRHGIDEPCPIAKRFNDIAEALRARLTQPEPEPVATLFGSLPVYDVPLAKPVAWVENLENARPHCVTDLKYCSVAQHERGEHLKYIPLYKDPTPCQTCEALARTVLMDQTSHDTPQREWQDLTDDESDEIWGECLGVFDCLRMTQAKLKEKNT